MGARVILELRRAAAPRRAEIGHDSSQIGLAFAEKRVVEARAAVEHRHRTWKAAAGELRRDDAAVRRPAQVKPLRPRAVAHELHQSARHAPGEPHRFGALARGEVVELRRSHGRGQRTDDAGGVKAARMKIAARSAAQPRRDLVADHDRRHHFGSRRRGRLADGERHRHDHASRMDDGIGEGVVEVARMRDRRVRKRGPCHRGPLLRSHLEHHAPRGRIARGEDESERVENAQPRERAFGVRHINPAHALTPMRKL